MLNDYLNFFSLSAINIKSNEDQFNINNLKVKLIVRINTKIIHVFLLLYLPII